MTWADSPLDALISEIGRRHATWLRTDPLPTPLGTPDALHLATALEWLAARHEPLVLATHDAELARAASACGLEVIGAGRGNQLLGATRHRPGRPRPRATVRAFRDRLLADRPRLTALASRS